MQTYTNGSGIPLSVAVWLATDNYDRVPNTISATQLIRPVRQIILGQRLTPEERIVDVLSVAKSRAGSAIHDSIERAWTHNREGALQALGYPDHIIKKILVNPDPEQLELFDDPIPVYMEQREFRKIDGVTIGGKFDFVAEGRVTDFKNTGTYTWTKGIKTEDYQLQGSIYRWLNPEKIYDPNMAVVFIFSDWMQGKTSTKNYPARPIEQKLIPLMDLTDTEDFIRSKLQRIEHFKNAPEAELPECSDKDLWRKETQYKYYKNPAKRTRATKNFDTAAEAYARKAKDGNVGVVVEVPGEVVACKYCQAFALCTQKDQLIADGSLKFD